MIVSVFSLSYFQFYPRGREGKGAVRLIWRSSHVCVYMGKEIPIEEYIYMVGEWKGEANGML